MKKKAKKVKAPVVISSYGGSADIAAYLNRVPEPVSVKKAPAKVFNNGGPGAQFRYNPSW